MRTGEWKGEVDGTTQGFPTNEVVVTESALIFKREKRIKGSRRALPFHYRYFEKLWSFMQSNETKQLYKTYVMTAASLAFMLRLRVHELVKLRWTDVSLNELNEDGVLHHLICLSERKYGRSEDCQFYAIYRSIDENCVCAFSHVLRWREMYEQLLTREVLPDDPLIQRANEDVSEVFWGRTWSPLHS